MFDSHEIFQNWITYFVGNYVSILNIADEDPQTKSIVFFDCIEHFLCQQPEATEFPNINASVALKMND